MPASRKSLLWFVPLGSLLLAGWSWTSKGIVHQLLTTSNAEAGVAQVLEYIEGFGVVAPLVYVVIVTIEVVVAPIPGLMLYAPGGILFGPIGGGALSLLGNTIGSAIACGLTRSMSNNWLSRFFEKEQLERLQQKMEARGPWIIFSFG